LDHGYKIRKQQTIIISMSIIKILVIKISVKLEHHLQFNIQKRWRRYHFSDSVICHKSCIRYYFVSSKAEFVQCDSSCWSIKPKLSFKTNL